MRARDIDRNAPCPCGSKRKFKRCCAARLERRERRIARVGRGVGIALALGLGIGAVIFFRSVDSDAPSEGTRRVWSPEHGHWHDAR